MIATLAMLKAGNLMGATSTGLVPTKLLDGDELGSFAGHPVAPAHDLAALYHMTPQAIVAANGADFTTDSINSFVARTGGRQSGSNFVFSSNSVILLPANGPREQAGSLTPGAAPVPKGTPFTEASIFGLSFAQVGLLGLAAWVLSLLTKSKKPKP